MDTSVDADWLNRLSSCISDCVTLISLLIPGYEFSGCRVRYEAHL